MAELPSAACVGADELWLVLPDGRRIPVERAMTIGRGDEASVQIADQTVSRLHARIACGPDGPTIEDAGSTFGTQLAGRRLTDSVPLRAGARIRLGDVVIAVEGKGGSPVVPTSSSPRGGAPSGPGETVIMPVDATLLGLRPAGGSESDGGEARPRVRSGWALKRLGDEEGQPRFVLRDLRSGAFLRLGAEDAALFELIDGTRTVIELLVEAERVIGPGGAGHLARLLAELADRSLLDGSKSAPAVPQPPSRLQHVLKPRERSWDGVGHYFERAYHRWGRVFFSPLSATFLVLFALAGFAAFAYLVGARYGTPFVVARRLVIGGAVFIAGRFALVAVHEIAHGMALAHYGRTAGRGGLRLLLIFPYAFVETGEAYFEPRRHRIVISAAGPACDLTLGSLFAFACAVSPRGALRDVFFQLAFGAYIGAFFNLNPFIDRDGYNILVDFLREPRLRQRARQQFARKLSGAPGADDGSPVVARYALAGLIWSALGATFAIILSTRYYHRLDALAPHGLILTVFIVFYVVLLIPVLAQLGMPLLRRARFGTAEVNRVLR
jgi:putative peptide zinc metalloprotease protein